MFIDENKYTYLGGDEVIYSYENNGNKWTYIDDTGLTGDITLYTDSATDYFYFYSPGAMNLTNITIILTGQTNVANVIFVTDELILSTSRIIIGNFIIGSSSDTLNINGYLAVTGTQPTSASVYTFAPYYTPLYSVLAISISWITIVGSPYGSIDGSLPGPNSISSADTLTEQNIIGDVFDLINSYLTNQDIVMSTITGNTTISCVQKNVYYYASTAGTLSISVDVEHFTDNDRAFIILEDDIDLTNVTWNDNNSGFLIYVICIGEITGLNSVGQGYVFICQGGIFCLPGAEINSPLYSVLDDVTIRPTGSTFATITYTAPCFLKGTKILTDRWYVPVEKLRAGDLVMTHGLIEDNKTHKADANILKPLKAVKHFTRLDSKATAPVCITRNAFGPNQPFEDLYVSRNHGVLRNGTLIPSGHLLNDDTIYQDRTLDRIEYYHLEFDTHYAITATGVLTESYLP